MTTLTLLDVDQLAPGDRDALAHIMGCFGVCLVAVYQDGAMHCLVPLGLEGSFLATIERDVSPVDIIAVSAMRTAA